MKRDRYMEAVEATRKAMANRPILCERCGKLLGQYDSWWESYSGQWICTACNEKVTPA